MAKVKNFEYVIDNDLCLGCAACTQFDTGNKITVHLDGKGFIRPVLGSALTSAEDETFGRICPGLSVQHKGDVAAWTDLWGPVRSSHVGWATDSATRYSGSSGGGITATMCFLIEKGLVDAVLHIGVSDHDPFENTYRISTTADEVRSNTGSRYAPAAPLAGLTEAVTRFEKVALVGKPCDIVAARNLAHEVPEVGRRITYFISFMCAGVPSFQGTDAVVKKLGVQKEKVVQFRYRGNGWPGFATATLEDGETKRMTYHESWGKVLNKHLQLRCKVCIDGTGEFADLTFADAWYGSETGYPEFEETEGRSLVLNRTENGQALMEKAVSAGYLYIESLPLENIEKMQPYQAVRKKLMLSRIVAMRLFGLKPPRYALKNMLSLALGAGVKNNIVSFLGMAKRTVALRKRAVHR
jgi:coenzyme F420 hydrogenase subunit beta